TDPPTDPPTDPTEPAPAAPEPSDPEVLPGDDETEDPEVAPADGGPAPGKPVKDPAGSAVEVPTVIAAGQTGWSTSELWGASLMGGGMALLRSSGTVLVSVRKD